MKCVLIILVASTLCSLIAAGRIKSNQDEPTECDEGVQQMIYNGNADFTGKFLYEALKAKPNENTIMSAFSVQQPIAQLALYAEGKTLQELLTTLNLPNKFHIRCGFPPLINGLKDEDENVVLNMASRIFATDAHPLSKDFLKDMKTTFGSEPESLNFNNGQAASNRINEWVEQETNKRIKQLTKPEMFNENTRLVLANAIYFLGNWEKPFDTHSTRDHTFTINNKQTVDIPMMYQQDDFKYGEIASLDCKVLEMSYKGGKYSFVVFLPNKVDGLSSMIEKLQDPSQFNKAYHNTGLREVRVYLPKLKIESEFNLIPIMKSAGISDLFDEFKSNLTGILEEYEPLYVTEARQKAFLEVDEKGTEAAGANAVFIGVPTSALLNPPPIPTFKADHPFAFYILHQANILFSGVFVKN